MWKLNEVRGAPPWRPGQHIGRVAGVQISQVAGQVTEGFRGLNAVRRLLFVLSNPANILQSVTRQRDSVKSIQIQSDNRAKMTKQCAQNLYHQRKSFIRTDLVYNLFFLLHVYTIVLLTEECKNSVKHFSRSIFFISLQSGIYGGTRESFESHSRRKLHSVRVIRGRFGLPEKQRLKVGGLPSDILG